MYPRDAKPPRPDQKATTPELKVAGWLADHKISFEEQHNLFGGATVAGGARVDFWLHTLRLVFRIQSYWHLDTEAQSRDRLQKAAIMSTGYEVVDIWESRLDENLDRTMRLALQGVELDSLGER